MMIWKTRDARAANDALAATPVAHVLDGFDPADPSASACVALGAYIARISTMPGLFLMFRRDFGPPTSGSLVPISNVHFDAGHHVAFTVQRPDGSTCAARLIPLSIGAAQAAKLPDAVGLKAGDPDAEWHYLMGRRWTAEPYPTTEPPGGA